MANEVVEETKKLNKFGLVFKIDFEKAYDHVEWIFLDEVLARKGIGSRLRKWVRGYLDSVNFSIMINGKSRGKFKASRGVRQRDPLSSFLFTVVIDVLSCLLDAAQHHNLIHGLFIGRDRVEVSHLQFADDTIFFLDDKEEYWFNLFDLLDNFCSASGMKINNSKSSVLGINCSGPYLARLAADWGCEVGNWPMTYLGLPLGGNPRAIVFWELMIEQIETRLQKWKKAFLSKGGRLTLIQAVLSNMPTYFMSLFKMPNRVIKKVEMIMRNFLWEGTEEGKRDYLVKWDIVTKPTLQGGLGAWALKEKNEALMAKWLWRFPLEPQSLWNNIIKSKYGTSSNG